MKQSINRGLYENRLKEAQKQGKLYNITGVPTFIIAEKFRIVGAQPLDAFRKILTQVKT